MGAVHLVESVVLLRINLAFNSLSIITIIQISKWGLQQLLFSLLIFSISLCRVQRLDMGTWVLSYCSMAFCVISIQHSALCQSGLQAPISRRSMHNCRNIPLEHRNAGAPQSISSTSTCQGRDSARQCTCVEWYRYRYRGSLNTAQLVSANRQYRTPTTILKNT